MKGECKMARLDKYLAKIGGEDITPPAPVSRIDKSLSVLATGEGDLPAPVSALDRTLNAAIEELSSDDGKEAINGKI